MISIVSVPAKLWSHSFPIQSEPVFNLQVIADHCYRVGEQGILVHNASDPCQECADAGKKRNATITNENGTFSFKFDECRTTHADGPVVYPPARTFSGGGPRSDMSALLLGEVGSTLRSQHQAGHLIGTPVDTPRGLPLIETLVPGNRVVTMAVSQSAVEESFEETKAVVSTHSTIWLSREEADGYRSDVGLLRPSDWLAANGVFAEGDRLELDLPEMGVAGEYQVMSIEPFAERSVGGGGLVTGCFHFSRGVICDLRIEGEAEVIGVTGLHPIWSEDRQDWITAGELRVGERLQRADGSTAVLLESRLRPQVEPVYNIEVERDHCYRVGEQGVLVHNDSAPCCALFPTNHFNGKPGNRIYLPQSTIVGGQWNGQKRSTGAEARLDKSNTGKPPGTDALSSIILPGWVANINQPGGPVIIARGHILGAQLGGSGEAAFNLIPVCQQMNLRMRSVETEVKRRVDAGEAVDYEVIVKYTNASDAIPKSISIRAISMTSSGQCWMLQQMPTVIVHPSSLNSCGS